jgi:hypothetical protein
MKRLSFAIPLFLCLCLVSADATAQNSERPSLFDQKVQQLLDKRPEIKKIYSRSEVAKHVIELLAERELSIENGKVIQPDGEEEVEFASPLENKAKNLSNFASSMESETSVAISRTNKDLIVGCANDDRMFNLGMPAYVSTNGGVSWRTRRLPDPVNSIMFSGGDPVITAAPDGGFYYTYLSYDFEFSFTDIQMAYSADGLNWELRKPVIDRVDPEYVLEDKQWIAVDRDPQSPHYGRLYVVWRRFDLSADYFPMMLCWSDDGARSWSDPIMMEFDHDHFAHIEIGKGGVVFITGSRDDEFDGAGGSHTLLVSQDGGESFDQREIAIFDCYPFIGESGHTCLKGEWGFRAYPYIAFDVDPATNDLYLISGTSHEDGVGDLVYHYSSDLGLNWKSFAVAKAGDFDGDRFMPAVCFDTKSKTAWATYYSSEEDPSNQMTKLYRLELTPDGVKKNETIQNEAFDPFECLSENRTQPFMGDYIDSDADQGRHVAVWGQSPPNGFDADVYVSITAVGVAGVTSGPMNRVSFELSEIVDQPVRDQIKLNYKGKAGQGTVELFDSKGSRVLQVNKTVLDESSIELSTRQIPAGFYCLTFTMDGESLMRKFVKQ